MLNPSGFQVLFHSQLRDLEAEPVRCGRIIATDPQVKDGIDAADFKKSLSALIDTDQCSSRSGSPIKENSSLATKCRHECMAA